MMHITLYLVTALLSTAPSLAWNPWGKHHNGCEHYRTFFRVPCPDGKCQNPDMMQYRDLFQEASDRFANWTKVNSPWCPGACAPELKNETTSIGRWTYSLECITGRNFKVWKTGIPAPPEGLVRVGDKGACNVNCKPNGRAPFPNQDCSFVYGVCND
ncbi:hypothetical protein FKW77_001141 [Venturia effusa]|uniref:Secreted protein n=1 Tax=Venturia effusa TaxID=50376 RepID=A0A517LM56_9PEZI|nr:hypothetical protein FKW77_001141 [Venturia effusa]